MTKKEVARNDSVLKKTKIEKRGAGGRKPKPTKKEVTEIIRKRFLEHLETHEIPQISTFIKYNLDIGLEYGYAAIRSFFYDNPEFSTLIKLAKHKRVGTMVEGLVNGDKSTTGCIFALKQEGYTDTQNINFFDKTQEANYKGKTTEELKNIITKRKNSR